MSTTPVLEQRLLKEWKADLRQEVLTGGQKKVGNISTFLKEFVQRHPEVQWRTAQKEYYDILREEKAKAAEAAAEEPKAKTDVRPVDQPPTPESPDQFKKGTTVKVRVVDVKPFAAFVKTMDTLEADGIIHKSQVSPEFVADCNMYFKFGDELHPQVVRYDLANDRVELSTKSHPPKKSGMKNLTFVPDGVKPDPAVGMQPVPLVNSMADKLADLKDKIVTTVQHSEVKNEGTNLASEAKDAELQQITKYLHDKIGVLSPKAGHLLHDLAREHGLFTMGLALGQVMETFEVDMGVYLAKELEQKLRVGL